MKKLPEDAVGTSVGANSVDMSPMGGQTIIVDRRHSLKKVPVLKKRFRQFVEEYSKSKYYLQPDGTWKQGGDGRSEGKTRGELIKMGVLK